MLRHGRGRSLRPLLLLTLLSLFAALALTSACRPERPLRLAVEDEFLAAGLLERLLPLAGAAGPVEVLPGSAGACLAAAARGEVDLALLPVPEAALGPLQASGRIAQQAVLLHNEYSLVGRAADPAGIGNYTDGALALRQLNRIGANFLVPALGTAARFKLDELWSLQTDRRASPGFMTVEGGAQAAVLAAHRSGGYTLVDRVTRIRYLEARGLTPRVLVRGGAEMANPYQLLRLRPSPGREDLAGRASALVAAWAQPEATRVIAGYGLAQSGEPYYSPGAPADKPRSHHQLPGPGSAAPLRPEARGAPNPHGAGGLPMAPPHAFGGVPIGPRPGAGPAAAAPAAPLPTAP